MKEAVDKLKKMDLSSLYDREYCRLNKESGLEKEKIRKRMEQEKEKEMCDVIQRCTLERKKSIDEVREIILSRNDEERENKERKGDTEDYGIGS
ncbi:MAG: hypothetical protein EZS28_023186 [Streblomastix strix]|uniref:Uncharacterized protein n=1 Tax=Streblomastix strix TaxID=222440 RepID=A0A5J4VG05_9EUKA|nr:MAG: hypothetical protein EZS28_023186 [Streblomastix strix]